MKHSKRSRSDRQAEAEARNAVAAAQSLTERIAIVKARPGNTTRELARLRKALVAGKKAKPGASKTARSGKDFQPTGRGH